MTFDVTQPNFKKLIRIISNGERRVIPFVGAGLSIYGPSVNALPQWSQLIQLLMEKSYQHRLLKYGSEIDLKLNSIIDKGNLISATDILVNEVMGLPTFRKTIQDSLDVSGKEIPPAIIELVSIAWSLIITTNLDNFIETAWAVKHGKPITVLTNKDASDLDSSLSGHYSKPALLKTHGTLERFETWVLSESHYDDVLNNNKAYVEALKLLYRQTLFFVGFGLSDRDFEPLLEQLTKIYPGGVGDYFALIPEHRSEQYVPLMRKFGLQPIWFKVFENQRNEPHGGYIEVKECLSHIVSEWLSHTIKIPIKLRYFPELEKTFCGRKTELKKLSDLIFQERKRLIQIVGFGGEGKTSLVQKWIDLNKEDLIRNSFTLVFGCSFYKSDIARFIDSFYTQLVVDGDDFDIASKVERICRVFRSKKILLVLDGFEIVQSENGEIRNSYLQDIIDAGAYGDSTILITSRIEEPKRFFTLSLTSLSSSEVKEVMKSWGIKLSGDREAKIVAKYVGNHALSVRIVASFLKSSKTPNIDSLGEINMNIDIPDEADSLRANKAVRVLEFYSNSLPNGCLTFMKCFSIYPRSVPEYMIMELFNKEFEEGSLPNNLQSVNLIKVITELKRRRLLQSEGESFLTCHPLVRDYFRDLVDEKQILPLHKESLDYFLKISPESPSSISDCFYLFSSCYHASKAGSFDIFHDLFYNRLNRGQTRYLGFVLGAWDECLTLCSYVFPNEDSKGVPKLEASYYYGMVSYSLSRLYRNEESIPYYLKSVWEGIKTNNNEGYVEAAIQSNCLMSALLLLGEYEMASRVVNLNIQMVLGISSEAERNWQTEHALTTIGRICLRIGENKKALDYYNGAKKARETDTYDVGRFHELERITHVDALLRYDKKSIAEAENEATEILKIAKGAEFYDMICGAYRVTASILRYKAIVHGDTFLFDEALSYIDLAMDLARKRSHLELEIQIRIEELSIILTRDKLKPKSSRELKEKIKEKITKLDELIHRSGLAMYAFESLYFQELYSRKFPKEKDDNNLRHNLLTFVKNRGDLPLYISDELNLPRGQRLKIEIPTFNSVFNGLDSDSVLLELKSTVDLLASKFGFRSDWIL